MTSPEKPSLAGNEVSLWIARVDECFEAMPEEEWLALLPEEERAVCLRARVDSVRQERTLARVLIRRGLSHFAARPPGWWRFTENEFGRPLVQNGTGLTFNASHSRGLVVCAFGRGREVGVDTESHERSVPEWEGLGRFLSPTEQAYLSKVPPEQYSRTFFRFWTLKEAYAKARGVGLSIGFDAFSIDLGPRPDVPPERPLLLDDRTTTRWHLHELSVPPHHLVGLAVEEIEPNESVSVLTRRIKECP